MCTLFRVLHRMIKLFGTRVAIKKEEQKFTGRIALPPDRFKLYDLGRVVAGGPETNFQAGQLVFFQLTQHSMENTWIHIDGQKQPLIVMDRGDILARLSDLTITVDSFSIAGKYLLLKPYMPKTESLIIIPDKAEDTGRENLRYTVVQVGDRVDLAGVHVGGEVYPDRGRCSPLQIGDSTFVFVDRDFILGVKE